MLFKRARNFYIRRAARLFSRRPLAIAPEIPLISFTFDDFPRSALLTGGEILESYGARGSYYAAFGLMGQKAPTGDIFLAHDITRLLERGHELGCHTFDHFDASETPPGKFENSVLANKAALTRMFPGASFKTLSYPIAGTPRVGTKKRMSRYFIGSRGGGQTFNSKTADLDNLAAYFLEKSHGDIAEVEKMIDANQRAGGWLILATHDIDDSPTPWGCTPGFFEHVVKYAQSSGARIMPMVEALKFLINAQSSAKPHVI